MADRPSGTRIQKSFRAMGTDAHVILESGLWSVPPNARTSGPDYDPQLRLRAVVDGIEYLEACWSRFRDNSELNRLNARNGRATVVSRATSLLIQRAVWAWRATRGRFDPTVLDAVVEAGYDCDFDVISQGSAGRGAIRADLVENHPGPAPGCGEILVDPETNLVILPPGVGVDPGGIGKGLAADLTATAAVESGAPGALVSLGGDLRVAGTPPSEGWEVELDHHICAPARINLRAGAVATSSVLRRRWDTPGGPAHHIIDPRTGAPSSSDAVAVSVMAGEAWWAEALATAILVDYGDNAFAEELDDLLGSAGALVTLADGTQLTSGTAGPAFSLGVSSRDSAESAGATS